jgi:hypothetical protein
MYNLQALFCYERQDRKLPACCFVSAILAMIRQCLFLPDGSAPFCFALFFI